MDKTFMGLPMPSDWSVVPDPETGNLILRNRSYPPFCGTASEITRHIERYWKEHPHEQYRQADSPSRNPASAQHAPGDTGRTSPGSATAPRKVTLAEYAAQAGLRPGGIIPLPSPPTAQLMREYQRMIAQQYSSIGYLGADFAEPPPKPLERAAPIIGELIGHRAWKVEGGNLLRSYSAGSAWFPSVTMQDKVGKGQEIEDHNSAGIWAFKDPYDLAHEFYSEITSGGVFGTVWLWGTVIEHERGYRAQYASVRSLDRAAKGVDLGVLRAAYLKKSE